MAEHNGEPRSEFFGLGSVTLHALVQGDPGNPAILFLHGFPQYSGMWRRLMAGLSDHFHCIAPDQRGYNLSSKPKEQESYAAGQIAGDAAGLIQLITPGRKAHVVGHDWGASIAYALAMTRPDLVESLIIINGVHPGPFQEALLRDPDQIAASQYIHNLRADGTAERLAADDCAKLMGLFGTFSDADWLTPTEQQDYLSAWQQEGAVQAMLNWYRASPIRVPKPGEDLSTVPNPFADTAKLRIRPRHLLIWADEDRALRPSSHLGLDAYCDALTRVSIEGSGHWVVNARPAEVLHAIRTFIV